MVRVLPYKELSWYLNETFEDNIPESLKKVFADEGVTGKLDDLVRSLNKNISRNLTRILGNNYDDGTDPMVNSQELIICYKEGDMYFPICDMNSHNSNAGRFYCSSIEDLEEAYNMFLMGSSNGTISLNDYLEKGSEILNKKEVITASNSVYTLLVLYSQVAHDLITGNINDSLDFASIYVDTLDDKYSTIFTSPFQDLSSFIVANKPYNYFNKNIELKVCVELGLLRDKLLAELLRELDGMKGIHINGTPFELSDFVFELTILGESDQHVDIEIVEGTKLQIGATTYSSFGLIMDYSELSDIFYKAYSLVHTYSIIADNKIRAILSKEEGKEVSQDNIIFNAFGINTDESNINRMSVWSVGSTDINDTLNFPRYIFRNGGKVYEGDIVGCIDMNGSWETAQVVFMLYERYKNFCLNKKVLDFKDIRGSINKVMPKDQSVLVASKIGLNGIKLVKGLEKFDVGRLVSELTVYSNKIGGVFVDFTNIPPILSTIMDNGIKLLVVDVRLAENFSSNGICGNFLKIEGAGESAICVVPVIFSKKTITKSIDLDLIYEYLFDLSIGGKVDESSRRFCKQLCDYIREGSIYLDTCLQWLGYKDTCMFID